MVQKNKIFHLLGGKLQNVLTVGEEIVYLGGKKKVINNNNQVNQPESQLLNPTASRLIKGAMTMGKDFETCLYIYKRQT